MSRWSSSADEEGGTTFPSTIHSYANFGVLRC